MICGIQAHANFIQDMAMILNYLRTSPTPKLNPARPLIPGSPPPAALPLDPVTYITCAVDSVAPLIRLRGYKGLAGGGKSLEVPYPIALRQRRRTAFQWILDAVEKKKSKGSGRGIFPNRVAEEIVAIVEGRSSLWDKRNLVHKMGTTNRANVAALAQRQRGKR
jgi:small subunit ribosomal protein S7